MSNIWGRFFHVFRGKKNQNLFENISVRTKNLHNISYMNFIFSIFFASKYAK